MTGCVGGTLNSRFLGSVIVAMDLGLRRRRWWAESADRKWVLAREHLNSQEMKITANGHCPKPEPTTLPCSCIIALLAL